MLKFLSIFFKQSGIWVATSYLVAKVSALLLTLFIARMLSKEDFGAVMYGLNYLGFFLPFLGMGSSHGTLRQASITSDPRQREEIIRYSFTYGFLYNILLNIIMLILAFFIFGKGNQLWLVGVFSFRLLGFFLLDQAKAEIRGSQNNKKFGQLDMVTNLFFLFSAILLTYLWGVKGYIISLCLAPFLVLLFHQFKGSWAMPSGEDFKTKEFWKFCFSMALTSQLSEMIFLLDVFFIGIFIDNTAVAHYRIYSIIPFNLFFLGALFFQTAYPKLCEYSKDQEFQNHFLLNFWKLMIPLVVMMIGVSYIWGTEILKFFGNNYYQNTAVFHILMMASGLVLLLRIPFGYLLASRGKAKYNLFSAAISIISILVFIKPVIFHYGLVGVAWLCFGNLLFIGLFLGFSYAYEWKKSQIS